MRVLVIEDDTEAVAYLVRGLSGGNHVVEHAANGPQGLEQALRGIYDAMVIDRMLPGMDGLSVIASLREAGNMTPVLVLSALGDVDDRVKGLLAGGDDYLVKPFALSELLARLTALTRRSNGGTRLAVADLELNLVTRQVTRSGREIELLPREVRLLEYLMRHAGQVVTRMMILDAVWARHVDPQTNLIDVHISRLRHKIDKGFAQPLLHTVRGEGYTLRRNES
jgi:two-component system, OmpR family, response regulator